MLQLEKPKVVRAEFRLQFHATHGTSRSSLLGEAQINLSDYLDSSKPSVVALPLHGSDCGAILHVSVQLLTSKAGLREVEPLREVSDGGLPANSDSGKLSTLGKAMVSRTDKVDPRLRFKPNSKEIRSLEVESGFSKEYSNATAGSDGSTNSSGSLRAEKYYYSRTQVIDGMKSTLSGDRRGSPVESPIIDKGRSDHPFPLHGSRNSVHQWGEQTYVNREVAAVYEENYQLKRVLEEANLSIDELRKEIDSLQNFTLSLKENLAKEVSKVKVECLKFKYDLEIVRNIKIAAKKVDIAPGVELCHPTDVLLPGLVSSETSSVGGGIALEGEFSKLLREVDKSKAERENLVRKMAHMECYYEAMIHELEETQKKILGELQNLRHEHSSCIYNASSTKAQMEMMHQQMNSERLLNKELERRRAAASEAALKKARMNYSISVNQLQKDLGVLSLQVLSMYETNENVSGKPLKVYQASLRDCEDAEIASHVDESSNVDHCEESQSRDVVLKTSLGLKSSVGSQDDDLYRKMQEELSEMLLENVNLDVFSVTLHQALLEASLDSRAEIRELTERLELSCRNNQSLRMKLQNISDEICTLKNGNAVFISRCSDLASENQTLEAKLRSVSNKKCVLTERIGELESLVAECINYKVKYECCEVEKAKIGTQLEQVATDKHRLSDEVSLLKEEVMSMAIKVEEYEKLQKMVNYIQERRENLLVSDDEQVNGLLPHNNEENSTLCESFMSIITCFNDKILQLMEDKKILLNERDVACVSFASAKAEVEVVKLEFEHDRQEMVSKLNVSSVLAEKLQSDFVAVSNKIQDSLEKQKKSTHMIEDLLSDFTKMEACLQELTSEHRDAVDRIMTFGSLIDELEDNRSVIRELKQKNRCLTELLQCNMDESDVLSNELDNFRRTTGGLQDELFLLRGIRDQLDTQILDLNSQLEDKDDKLTRFEHQEAELNLLKQQLSDVESEKIILQCQLKARDDKLTQFKSQEYELNHLKRRLSEVESEKISLQHQLSFADEHLKEGAVSESQLLEMHGLLIATDVVQTVVLKQYKLHVEELFSELEYVHKNLEEADKKNLDHYASENVKLMSHVESLKTILEFNVALNQALEQSNSSNVFEIGELKCLLRSSQAEIEDLVVSKEELEIRSLVLQTTIDEMSATIISLEQRTKDHHQAYDKNKFGGSPFASQDSLRVAFMKEEYETKLEEIRHQLSISEKHGEDMLLKLQDALDDLERRKKREASQLKRNEQLALKIAELETELNLVVSENRENFAAYEQLKAELDCSDMSLDCCKEENIQLVSSLQECNDYNRKLSNEMDLLQEQLQNLKDSTTSADGCHAVNENQNWSSDVGSLLESSLISSTARCKEAGFEEGNLTNFSDEQANRWTYTEKLKLDKHYGREANLQATQEALVTDATDGLSERINSDIDAKHNGYLLKDQLKPQFLMSVIERFREQLEQMKSENTLPPDSENLDELLGEVSHRNQLHQVSEELENTSSLYRDSSRSGYIFGKGLVKALQAKNSSMQFLSSFPRQLDSREAAVSESFGSINEPIKDMLEIKEGYVALETELREMHERYSKLSLDFAEVEGERQRLVLMLKNVRPSKSVLRRSLTCSHEGLSS